MDLDEFNDRMFSIEKRLDLFADRSEGLPWWDGLRYEVYVFLYGAISGVPAIDPERRPFHLRALGWLQRAFLKALLSLRIRAFKYDVLVLRAPRQFKQGRRFDPAIDDLVALCPGRRLTINTSPHYYHLGRRGRRRGCAPAAVDDLIKMLKTELGGSWSDLELRRLIEARLGDFQAAVESYSKFFSRIRPRFIIMTQNGMEKGLFVAAAAAGIRVIEGQHGLIGPAHPAYSYPRDLDFKDRSSFPAVFLAFSDFWIRSCYYPAAKNLAIGNDHFAVSEPPPIPNNAGVMFVSADVYHGVLRGLVARLAHVVPDRRIIYKLHPNQRYAIAAIRAEFAAIKNIDVIDASVLARTLLPTISHVVVVQSTVAYEALEAGRRVCIVPELDYCILKGIFGLDGVTITPGLEELSRAVEEPVAFARMPSFFDPFDRVQAARLLGEAWDTAAHDGARRATTTPSHGAGKRDVPATQAQKDG